MDIWKVPYDRLVGRTATNSIQLLLLHSTFLSAKVQKLLLEYRSLSPDQDGWKDVQRKEMENENKEDLKK